MSPTTILAFHAEQLHDNRVWHRVHNIAVWMAQHGWYATFFVYPFRSQVAGREIADRVQRLAALQHEIGQHTHFYLGTRIDKPHKANDLSEGNILHCVRRDYETLCQMGVRPQGFTAGAWLVDNVLPDILITLGFVYDCSARFPGPSACHDAPYHRWLRAPQHHVNATGRLLYLPTTHSLGMWWRQIYRREKPHTASYQLIYLHDYDLLSLRNYILLKAFLTISKNHDCVPAGIMAKRLSQEEYKHHV